MTVGGVLSEEDTEYCSNPQTKVNSVVQDRWSSRAWRKIYWRTYKQFRTGKLGQHVDLVKLVDKLYNDEHPTQPQKKLHVDLQILKTDPETGRQFANPDRSVALYLRELARDEPDDYTEVKFNTSDPSNPLENHPKVNIRRRKKRATSTVDLW